MNKNEQELRPGITDDNKISIIDLFVVLLKYRKLIIGTVLAALIAAGIGFFVYPSWRYNAYIGDRSQSAGHDAKMVINPSPASIYFLPNQQIALYFSRPDVILGALGSAEKDVSPETLSSWIPVLSSKEGTEKRTMESDSIEKVFVSQNGRLTIKEDTKTRIIEFSCTGFEGEQARLFLEELFVQGNAAVETYIKSLGEAYIASFEKTLQNPNLSEFEKSLAGNGREYYFLARGLLAGDLRALVMLIEPYTARVPVKSLGDFRNDYTKMALVGVFILLFLSVFIAFVLDAIHSIKNDEEAMKKIHDALEKTGGNQS
ncbi:hypothetical protein FACS1894110_25870 [Spirochaetia bacterium]|nr:hypothetical protein FACS1894110_25870 [Spirochaetia bacterium]